MGLLLLYCRTVLILYCYCTVQCIVFLNVLAFFIILIIQLVYTGSGVWIMIIIYAYWSGVNYWLCVIYVFIYVKVGRALESLWCGMIIVLFIQSCLPSPVGGV